MILVPWNCYVCVSMLMIFIDPACCLSLPTDPAEIRSWWEVPCIAHFCYIFRKPFKLPEFEIEVSVYVMCALSK